MIKNMDMYLEMSEDQLDNLLMGLDLNDNSTSNNSSNNLLCYNCNSIDLVIDNLKGHKVCNECGVINEEYLDDNPDIINSESDVTNSRYGGPSNYFFPKASLGTKIVSKGFNKLSLLQKQGQMPYKEKSLMDVLETIQSKCKKYCITQSTIDSAKILYKKVSESVHQKGKRKGKQLLGKFLLCNLVACVKSILLI